MTGTKTTASVRRIFLSFEFERDSSRRPLFLAQAALLCDFTIIDKSLPAALHDVSWQREVRARLATCHAMFVLLGPDTHNSPGVLDELSLAGEFQVPVFQLLPQKRQYGLVSRSAQVLPLRWKRINQALANLTQQP